MDNLRTYFGQELAFWRRQKGFTQESLAREINYSVKSIQGLEQGLRAPTDDLSRRLDGALGLDGVLRRAGEVARADITPWGSYREFEQQAIVIRMYNNFVVPGLLQTEDYAREVIAGVSPSEDVEEVLADRMARQERLHGDEAPHVHVIIDEAGSIGRSAGRECSANSSNASLTPAPRSPYEPCRTRTRHTPALGVPSRSWTFPRGIRSRSRTARLQAA